MAGPLRFDGPAAGHTTAQHRALLAALLRRARAYTRAPGRKPAGAYTMRLALRGALLGYSPTWALAYNIASQPRYAGHLYSA